MKRTKKEDICCVKVVLNGKDTILPLSELLDLYYRKMGIIREVK